METVNRLSYFDFLRGIAILMVIGIHTYIIRPFDGITNIFQIGVRDCLTFAVPLFLSISGFFLGRKRELYTKEGYSSFLRKQMPRVYIPAFLWSLPIVALWIYQGQAIGTSISKGLLCMSFGPYYYIILIMQFYILLPVIKRMADKPILGGVFYRFLI